METWDLNTLAVIYPKLRYKARGKKFFIRFVVMIVMNVMNILLTCVLGLSGWIPVLRRQNGVERRRRSCYIWPS